MARWVKATGTDPEDLSLIPIVQYPGSTWWKEGTLTSCLCTPPHTNTHTEKCFLKSSFAYSQERLNLLTVPFLHKTPHIVLPYFSPSCHYLTTPRDRHHVLQLYLLKLHFFKWHIEIEVSCFNLLQPTGKFMHFSLRLQQKQLLI